MQRFLVRCAASVRAARQTRVNPCSRASRPVLSAPPPPQPAVCGGFPPPDRQRHGAATSTRGVSGGRRPSSCRGLQRIEQMSLPARPLAPPPRRRRRSRLIGARGAFPFVEAAPAPFSKRAALFRVCLPSRLKRHCSLSTGGFSGRFYRRAHMWRADVARRAARRGVAVWPRASFYRATETIKGYGPVSRWLFLVFPRV